MTAERREYSRPKGKFDVQALNMPPPPFNMNNEQFYPEDNFSYGFEPTQEQQWNNDNVGVGVGWVPSGNNNNDELSCRFLRFLWEMKTFRYKRTHTGTTNDATASHEHEYAATK